MNLRVSKRKVIKARLLWNAVLTSQIGTGPYLLYKDACNQRAISKI